MGSPKDQIKVQFNLFFFDFVVKCDHLHEVMSAFSQDGGSDSSRHTSVGCEEIFGILYFAM